MVENKFLFFKIKNRVVLNNIFELFDITLTCFIKAVLKNKHKNM